MHLQDCDKSIIATNIFVALDLSHRLKDSHLHFYSSSAIESDQFHAHTVSEPTERTCYED